LQTFGCLYDIISLVQYQQIQTPNPSPSGRTEVQVLADIFREHTNYESCALVVDISSLVGAYRVKTSSKQKTSNQIPEEKEKNLKKEVQEIAKEYQKKFEYSLAMSLTTLLPGTDKRGVWDSHIATALSTPFTAAIQARQSVAIEQTNDTTSQQWTCHNVEVLHFLQDVFHSDAYRFKSSSIIVGFCSESFLADQFSFPKETLGPVDIGAIFGIKTIRCSCPLGLKAELNELNYSTVKFKVLFQIVPENPPEKVRFLTEGMERIFVIKNGDQIRRINASGDLRSLCETLRQSFSVPLNYTPRPVSE
jgi:hypothetical protein